MQIVAVVSEIKGSHVTLLTEEHEFFEKFLNERIVLEHKGSGRSLNANSYFHVLSDKLAEKLHTSKPFMKNLLMSKYGQKEIDENGKQLMFSALEGIPILERGDIHCEIKGYGHADGKTFIHYGVLKPTHIYTKSEMSTLIDGTVEDAKEQLIEVLTPSEIEHMKQLWKGRKR